MRKAPVVLGATIAGLAGLFAYHTHPGTGVLATAPPATAPPGSSSKSGGSTTTSPTTSPPGPTGNGTTPTTAPPAGTPTTSAPAATSATGPAVQYGYGVLSVKVDVHNGKITDVSVPRLQTAETYSQQLANQVIPMLRSEVLSVQSARINGISGATYTSEAFAQSLQSALSKLHFK